MYLIVEYRNFTKQTSRDAVLVLYFDDKVRDFYVPPFQTFEQFSLQLNWVSIWGKGRACGSDLLNVFYQVITGRNPAEVWREFGHSKAHVEGPRHL